MPPAPLRFRLQVPRRPDPGGVVTDDRCAVGQGLSQEPLPDGSGPPHSGFSRDGWFQTALPFNPQHGVRPGPVGYNSVENPPEHAGKVVGIAQIGADFIEAVRAFPVRPNFVEKALVVVFRFYEAQSFLHQVRRDGGAATALPRAHTRTFPAGALWRTVSMTVIPAGGCREGSGVWSQTQSLWRGATGWSRPRCSPGQIPHAWPGAGRSSGGPGPGACRTPGSSVA